MGKIKLLDKTVSNMIAAGEVVERPASVVKELLENSIDAGARHITVEIKNGGVKYIRVADDGIGMTKEDAKMSLLRHATSKISTAGDLEAILTLGFRGEALASIAAVSNMEIYTKGKDEKEGTLIKSSCGEITDTFDAGCPDGTTIIVRDLFVNTPARMKFLKKEHTEAGYIADIITRLSLAKPDISFKFINNDKEQIFTTGDGELINTIYSIYGKDIKNAMAKGEYSEFGITLFGYFGKSEAARPNRNMQNIFINGRYIKSPLISHAVEEAYKQELMTGKFPSCVLNIEIDPHCVDINVHPTKLEAKFSDEKAVYHVVYWAAKNALYQKREIPVIKKDIPVQKTNTHIQENVAKKLFEGLTSTNKGVLSFSETSRPAREEKEIEVKTVLFETKSAPKPEPPSVLVTEKVIPPQEDKKQLSSFSEPVSFEKDIKEIKIEETQTEIEHTETKPQKTIKEEEPKEIPSAPTYKICGQVFDTYIIVEKDSQMLMVDQHAAHERLRFESLKESYKNRQIASQTLLTPAIIKLTPLEMSVFAENSDEINNLGFQAEEFGDNEIIVRGVPLELTDGEIRETIVEIISLYSAYRKNVDEQLVEKMLYCLQRRHKGKQKTLRN